MIKLTDVAKLAGVSTATVSRVIASSGYVAEETRKKVLDAVQELNYHPNLLGRQLRRMETKTVLAVVPDITNTFFSKVLRGIESVALQHGYQVLVGDTQNQAQSEQDYLNHLRHKQADGVILLTARSNPREIEEMAEEYPIVLACEYFEGSTIPTVSIDNVSSARRMTQHLIERGFRRIAHLSGPMEVILSRDRLKGYQQALAQYGLEADAVLIQEGDFSYESGYRMMGKLLALQTPPDAVFAANDEMAIGALKAVKDHGLRAPQDMAVVGFDDIQLASLFEPALTTIAQPVFEIGATAMELLLRRMANEALAKRQFVLEDTLVVRESCGTQA